ncbi:hypothetical protein AB0875_12445 [Micromonospora gifhornensis]|uniref:hypothetical protein n=1 Tax=Micromonospora gifhornensis TaxID=84594 RepID=UPI00345367BA
MIALALAAIALAAITLLIALTSRRSIRARYAGRRDQAAGRRDLRRTDLAYVDGAATEYLRRTGGRR